jgi:hypothetical protein
MAQDYSPSLVTKNLVFCGDAAMKSAAGPATLLYDKVNNNNGTMYNGTCLDFDGTDDSVDVPDSSDLDGFSKFTLSGWVNPNVTGGYRVIFDKYFPSGYTWRISNIDYPYIYINGSYLGSSTAVIEGAWNHLVVTYDGTSTSNNVNFYMAGELVDTGTLNTGTVGTNSYVLKIGEDYDGSSSPMDGKLADLRIYDVILSAANVKELYDDSKVIIPTKNDASGGFVAQTNLKGWWPLTEGVGTIAYDGSGNGNDGTLTNMTSADGLTGQTGAPQLVEGYNRPMLFPGATTDYVAVGNTSEFCFGTSDFSFGAWIKTSNTATFNMVFDALRPVNKGWQFGVYGTSPYMRLWASTGWSQVNVDASTNVCDGQWHHVGFTSYAGSPQLVTLYVDGSADASSGSMGALNMVGGAYASWIGGQADGPNYPFDGLINEVVLYDALLSSSEMAALAATGPNGGPLPPDPMSGASNLSAASNVKGYWRNDGDVTWTDRSGEGNNGTVAGSPDALLFKQGYNGQKNVNTGRDNQGFPLLFEDVGAIGFTSPTSPWMSSSYVDLGSDSVLDLATGTIDMWFRLANPMSGGSNSASGYLLDGGPSYFYFSSSSSQLYYFLSGASANVSSLSGTWDTNWHNVIVKSDGITAYMYIDGVQQTTADASGEDLFVFDASVKIGHSSASIVGQVAGLRLYNRALTYSEIQQNFNAQRSRFNV